MPLYAFEGKKPRIRGTAYVHETAVVTGDVTVGENCYIGAGACLRGDWEEIVVCDGSNIQENVVIHAGPDSITFLGPNSHIGHGAILHGCRLEEHVLVGMGAIINDGAHLGEGAVIASGALVPPGMEVPAGKLLVGVPARVTKDVDEQTRQFIWMGTRLYQTLPGRYQASLLRLSPEECTAENG
ncbi:MAG: gamma carbonic anhydrase family protein [Actinobacteria bacterium]|nr:gamma carbonic anhydrase family protein [Actinomycetota bacterium]